MTILVIGKVYPEPLSSAAGKRMLQLMDILLANNNEVHFATSAQPSEFSNPLPDQITVTSIKVNDPEFDVYLEGLDPEIVLFDRFMMEEQFGWRVAAVCPNALRILNTEDLHGLREGRTMAVNQGERFSTAHLNNSVMHREIAAIVRCDVSLIISTFELKLLQEQFNIPKAVLHYLPLLSATDNNIVGSLPAFDERHHFYSIGNFLHTPNYDAVVQLKRVIWPLIRKELPSAELHIYGAYVPEKVRQLHQEKEGFIIKGRAKNAAEVAKEHRLCLAPLRIGAGQKGKLLEAMENGTPSITTEIGAEAMHGSLAWAGFIENDMETFAARAVQLYNGKHAWEAAQKRGSNILRNCFDANLFEEVLYSKLVYCSEHLKKHRDENKWQGVLTHHTVKSHEYLSKWIMAKNSK